MREGYKKSDGLGKGSLSYTYIVLITLVARMFSVRFIVLQV